MPQMLAPLALGRCIIRTRLRPLAHHEIIQHRLVISHLLHEEERGACDPELSR
jgi:hypothetical protein